MVRDADAAAKKAAEAKLAAMMEAKFLDMFGGDDDGDAGGASVKKKKKAPKGGRAVQAAAARAKLGRGGTCRARGRGGRQKREKASRARRFRLRGWPAVVQRQASSSTVGGGGGEHFPAVAIVAERRASGHVHGRQAQRRGVQERRHRVRQPPRRLPRQKLFMNDRVDKVHEVAVNERAGPKERFGGAYARTAPSSESWRDSPESPSNDMRREVQLEAAKGLNKWDRKALEGKRLQQLGAKAEKGIRIPATIGVDMWRAREREARGAEAARAVRGRGVP